MFYFKIVHKEKICYALLKQRYRCKYFNSYMSGKFAMRLRLSNQFLKAVYHFINSIILSFEINIIHDDTFSDAFAHWFYAVLLNICCLSARRDRSRG